MATSIMLHASDNGKLAGDILDREHPDLVTICAASSDNCEVTIFATREQAAQLVTDFRENDCLPPEFEVEPKAEDKRIAEQADIITAKNVRIETAEELLVDLTAEIKGLKERLAELGKQLEIQKVTTSSDLILLAERGDRIAERDEKIKALESEVSALIAGVPAPPDPELPEFDDPCPDCGLDRTTCGHVWTKAPEEVPPQAHAEALATERCGQCRDNDSCESKQHHIDKICPVFKPNSYFFPEVVPTEHVDHGWHDCVMSEGCPEGHCVGKHCVDWAHKPEEVPQAHAEATAIKPRLNRHGEEWCSSYGLDTAARCLARTICHPPRDNAPAAIVEQILNVLREFEVQHE